MRLETRTVSISKRDFFWILMRRTYSGRRSLWIVLSLLSCVGIFNAVSKGDFLILWLALGLIAVLAGYSPISIARYVTSEDTANFYARRKYVITDDTLTVELESGTVSQFPLSRITKAVRYGNYYLLFLSPQQYFYVPADCFASAKDAEMFSEILIQKSLL
jgi:hypothetical protein